MHGTILGEFFNHWDFPDSLYFETQYMLRFFGFGLAVAI